MELYRIINQLLNGSIIPYLPSYNTIHEELSMKIYMRSVDSNTLLDIINDLDANNSELIQMMFQKDKYSNSILSPILESYHDISNNIKYIQNTELREPFMKLTNEMNNINDWKIGKTNDDKIIKRKQKWFQIDNKPFLLLL